MTEIPLVRNPDAPDLEPRPNPVTRNTSPPAVLLPGMPDSLATLKLVSSKAWSQASELPRTIEEYKILDVYLESLPEDEKYRRMGILGMRDLFYLLSRILSTRTWMDPCDPSRKAFDHPWLLQRCREVQFASDNVLDIWARFHFKSTIKTFGEVFRQILLNPDITVGIFSITNSIANEFVHQLKFEFETNKLAKKLYPHVFYDNWETESPKWSIDKGFTVRRTKNYKNPTVRGYGLLNSNFTGARLALQVFDDAVNEQAVATQEMNSKTVKAWEYAMSVGFPTTRRLYCGTFYAHGDPYHEMIERGGIQLRLHPCYAIDLERSKFSPATGLPEKVELHYDQPVLYPLDYLVDLAKNYRSTWACQFLCDPNASEERRFNLDDLRHYQQSPARIAARCQIVIIVDPADSKSKVASRTAMWVCGIHEDGNIYILDLVLDKMDLYSKTETLFRLVRDWQRGPKKPLVIYEKYSMQADIQHIEYVMEHVENYRFSIEPAGGNVKKLDRIERLIPAFRDHRMWFPRTIFRTTTNGENVDMLAMWISQEFSKFPNSLEMDGLDALARLFDPDLPIPGPRQMKVGAIDAYRAKMYEEQKGTSGESFLSL